MILTKTIAYILTTYPCLSETFAQREITQLQKQGFEVIVFAADGKVAQPMSNQKITTCYRPVFLSFDALWSVVRVCIRHPALVLKTAVLFVKLLFVCPSEALVLCGNIHTICFFARVTEKRNVSHIHAYFLSWPACIGLGLSILTKLPLSISAHARDIFIENGAYKLKVQYAKFVTCCTREGLNHLKKRIIAEYHSKLFLNYHGIELNGHNRYRICSKNGTSSDLIVAAGRLVKKKGFEHLLEAFDRVVQKKPDAALVIAGDGPQRRFLKSMIERLGLRNNVHLTGWLEHDHTLKLIEQAKALVVPSIVDRDGDRDGIPNVILEAFSVCTSVIASSLPGIAEIVSNERTGLLVEPGDTERLAVAIERLLADTDLADFLADNARKAVRRNFNIEETCRKLAELFEKAVL